VDGAGFLRALDRLGTQIERELEHALDAATSLTKKAAQESTAFQDRSGNLRKSIDSERVGTWERIVRADTDYANFVENGTRQHGEGPYPIPSDGTDAKILHFELNGQTFLRRRVMHPGIRPTYFLRDAARNVEPEFRELVRAGIAGAIRWVGL